MNENDLLALARELLRDKKLRHQVRETLGPKALADNRVSNWNSGREAITSALLEGLALGIFAAGEGKVGPSGLRSLLPTSVPNELSSSRPADLIQMQMWAEKVIHLTVVSPIGDTTVEPRSTCTTVRYWHRVHRFNSKTNPFAYDAYSDGKYTPEKAQEKSLGMSENDKPTLDSEEEFKSGSSKPTIKIKYRTKIPPADSQKGDEDVVNFGFSYTLSDVFQPTASKSNQYEFSSAINLMPALDSLLIVILPEAFVDPRFNAVEAREYVNAMGLPPMKFLREILVESLNPALSVDDYKNQFQSEVEPWSSGGQLLNTLRAGNQREDIPTDFKDMLLSHNLDIWSSFPQAFTGSRILAGHFPNINPLKRFALFWQLPPS